MSDRYVTYRAVTAGPHVVPAAELRIRTYGGPIPAELDLQYRRSVALQITGMGAEIAEIAVSDMPLVESLDRAPVHGFVDVRDGVTGGRWRNALWSDDGARSHDPALAV